MNVALPFLVCSALAYGQNIVGDWHGSIEIKNDAPLRLALHVSRNDDGSFRATLDSLDEGGSGLAVDSITLRGAKLRFEMKSVGGFFEGTISTSGSDSRIVGLWRQDEHASPLTWERGDDPLSLSHPIASEQALERGRKCIRDFSERKTANVWEQLAPVMKQQLGNEAGLTSMFERTREQFGFERNLISERVESEGALQTYRGLARFEKSASPIEVTISFNPRGAITRFDFRTVL